MADAPGTHDAPEPDRGLVKIGDFARTAGTNLRTLRDYEEIGLLEPASRSPGGVRFYRRTDVNRFRMVQTLQDLGLPLERIRALMATRAPETGAAALRARVRAALVEQDELLAARAEELLTRRRELARALAKLEDCRVCGERPSPANNFCEPCSFDGDPLPRDLSALF
jgi:DNA-binding transcriptional MerR regulator